VTDVISALIPALSAYPFFGINFGFARYFRRHEFHKRREYICLFGVCSSFVTPIVGLISSFVQNIIIFGIFCVLFLISILAIISHFYYYIVQRPVPLNLKNMVDYNPLNNEKK